MSSTRRRHAPLLLAASCSLVLAATAVADTGDTEQSVDLRAGAAQRLAHVSADTWRTAGSAGFQRSDELVLQLFTFAGASRLVADRLADPTTPRSEVTAMLDSLSKLAGRVQDALDRAPHHHATRDAWADSRRVLARLRNPSTMTRPPREPVRERAREHGAEPQRAASAPPPVEPVDPDAPRVEIRSKKWSGGFTPDLVLSGRFEGRGLVSAELVVHDSSGRVRYRHADELNTAIQSAMRSVPRDGLVTVSWSHRIDDDDLASGTNTIAITLVDSKGRKAVQKEQVRKRLF